MRPQSARKRKYFINHVNPHIPATLFYILGRTNGFHLLWISTNVLCLSDLPCVCIARPPIETKNIHTLCTLRSKVWISYTFILTFRRLSVYFTMRPGVHWELNCYIRNCLYINPTCKPVIILVISYSSYRLIGILDIQNSAKYICPGNFICGKNTTILLFPDCACVFCNFIFI